MKSLPSRVISALAAILLFSFTYYFVGLNGIMVLAFSACLVGCIEYMLLVIKPLEPPPALLGLFIFVSVSLILIELYSQEVSGMWAVLLAILYYIFCAIWALNKKYDNQKLLNFIALSVLGFFYCALLPTFVLKLLQLRDGASWFLLLLAIVFAGDVSAYFGGILLGRTKLMPAISPSKTVAGAIFGVMGSAMCGFLANHFILHVVSDIKIVICTIIAALLAQSGDLFESLIKRVAQVKDSGRIMPGHGGVLDRLDGVYFAAPLIYSLALTVNS